MSVLRVQFLFRVGPPNEPLAITKDLLGKTYEISHPDGLVEISLPTCPDDWLFWQPFIPGEYRTFIDWGRDDEVSLYIIRVVVTVESDVTAAMPLKGEVMTGAVQAIDKARDIAARVVTAFVAWVRATTRLAGLPLSNEVPPLAGPVLTIDEAAEPVRTGPSIKTVLTGRDPSGRYRMASPDLEDIIEPVRQGEEAPIAETLLADAEHYALYRVHDLRRAVLMAAIACEVKAKAALREQATEAQRSLLDFALDSPREITVTAADGLFDKLMLATTGPLATAGRQGAIQGNPASTHCGTGLLTAGSCRRRPRQDGPSARRDDPSSGSMAPPAQPRDAPASGRAVRRARAEPPACPAPRAAAASAEECQPVPPSPARVLTSPATRSGSEKNRSAGARSGRRLPVWLVMPVGVTRRHHEHRYPAHRLSPSRRQSPPAACPRRQPAGPSPGPRPRPAAGSSVRGRGQPRS
jgi:hypothetical protein